MTTTTITKTEASSEEVSALVGAIEDAVTGAPVGVTIIALLSLAILIQKPDISVEGLQQVLRDTSNYLCMALEEAPADGPDLEEPVPDRLLN